MKFMSDLILFNHVKDTFFGKPFKKACLSKLRKLSYFSTAVQQKETASGILHRITGGRVRGIRHNPVRGCQAL